MNAKEAVAAAKTYVEEMFADEQITDLGLEEVEFEDATNCWRITVGFSRPQIAETYNKNPFNELRKGGSLIEMMREKALSRSYKVVTINDNSAQVVSVKNRELHAV